jgi:flagellar hook-basal body complex protein FliE
MPSPINFSSGFAPLRPLSAAGTESAGGGRAGGPVNFQDMLLKSLEQVNELDRQSQSIIAGALTGEDYTQAEMFTAVKKADLAFRTMLQIRNKLLDAYNELKNVRM